MIYHKVTFYMKSGNSFSLHFKKFEISKLTDNKNNREMTYKDCREGNITIDLDELEAVVIGR